MVRLAAVHDRAQWSTVVRRPPSSAIVRRREQSFAVAHDFPSPSAVVRLLPPPSAAVRRRLSHSTVVHGFHRCQPLSAAVHGCPSPLLPISVNRCCSGRLRHRRCQLPRCRCSCSGLHAAAAACRRSDTSAVAAYLRACCHRCCCVAVAAAAAHLRDAADAVARCRCRAAAHVAIIVAARCRVATSASLRAAAAAAPVAPVAPLPLLLVTVAAAANFRATAATSATFAALQIVLPRCRRCFCACCFGRRAVAALQIAALPLLPVSTLPLLLCLRCCPCHRRRCPTPRCGCYRRQSAAHAAAAHAPFTAASRLRRSSSSSRSQLEGLGISPKAHPLPPLARTLTCLILGASPLNFAGYLLRDGRELRKTSHGFLKQIT